eukprot:TRINITY_DN24578_c0_g1_i1.p1 TRINITY_DN24578_c0_g1~~TRINITY_DN24578_c0_g1_i1.p1  ORF type:complete len:492 (+),score=51.04 TRINITY_DN24578_c0_g1_i1:98-1477(+)
MQVGSCLSVRDFARLGSSLSVCQCVRFGSSLSVLDFFHLGASLSLRGFSRLGSALSFLRCSRMGASLSVLDFSVLGAALSLRRLARVGSSLSLWGLCRLGSSISVLDFSSLGSTLAVRAFVRLASGLSVRGDSMIGGCVNIVSCLSIRHVGRFGSTLSVCNMVRLGKSLSVVDFLHLGSSVSLRSFARLGSSMSILRFATLGSSLALRCFSRLGSTLSGFGSARFGSTLAVHGNLYVGSRIYFNGPDNFMYYDTGASELRIHAGGNKRMSISTTGGSLHGTWSSESIISASDRRLKRRIEPLGQALASSRADTKPGSAPQTGAGLAPAAGGQPSRARTVNWVLRELRPVSYKFKEGPDAKYSRYGFVAQELEKVMPDVVRTHKEEKHVVYQDLVAFLTLASQVQQDRLEEYEARARERTERLKKQASLLTRLSRSVSSLAARIGRWEALAKPFWRADRR